MNEAALVNLLFRPERPLQPAALRRKFEDGLTPVDIVQQEVSALLGADGSEAIAWGEERITHWRGDGIFLITPFSDGYPEQMRSVFDYPVLLFARGVPQNDARSVAIVGSREASPRALAFADALGGLLPRDAVTVVSGLALGIDGTAHRAALAGGGRTVAVLGNGLNYTYPRVHAGLQHEIEERGMVLSQYKPDEHPTRRSFPARNITMSAFSTMTAIIEAGEKSGTRIQAEAAVKHGRPLLITRQVADETTWGRNYASGGYDVTVVESPEEARDAVVGILNRLATPAPVLASA